MLKVDCDLIGTSPIGFSAPIVSTKAAGETHDEHEQRTWRERLHVTPDGYVFHPAMALKNCLSECAKYLSESVPGGKRATYTKHVESGIMVTDDLMMLDGKGNRIKAADVPGLRLFVPADGRRGGGSRVWKTFPHIPEWRTHASLYLLDPVLCAKDGVMRIERYLDHAGKFIGIGYWRPRNNGMWGRWSIDNFKVSEE